MKVNETILPNYTLGSFGSNSKKGSKELKENEIELVSNNSKLAVNPEKMSEDMNIMGLQNKFLVNRTSIKEVNPADYLDDGRISDIEALMDNYDAMTEMYAKEYQELGFSKADSYALAGYTFAKIIDNAEVEIMQE